MQRFFRKDAPLRSASRLKPILQGIGVLGPARKMKAALRARGWFEWKPLVPEEQFSASCDLAIKALRAQDYEFGDYLEFGVSRGTSMACMDRALCRAGLLNVRLIGFDSFKGLPSEAAGQGWNPGEYASTIGATKRYLRKAGVRHSQVRLVKGWFKDTLTPKTIAWLQLHKASLIMVDCDIYTASREALWFCEPLILDRAILFFDDYGWRADKGEIGQQEAFAEFLEAFPHFAFEPLPAYRPEARMFLVTRSA